jgi:hypothetical protein
MMTEHEPATQDDGEPNDPYPVKNRGFEREGPT